jgi:hypothetical protein
MRSFKNRQASILATVTGISVGIAGVLLFIRFGPPAGPEAPPDPAEAANARSASSRWPGLPTFPSLPGRSGQPGGSGSPGGSPSPTPTGGPYANAPTDNLRKVAAGIQFKYKGTTGLMTVPAGLNLTGTVQISVLWDETGPRPTRVTQDYTNATGNRSIFLFPPGDGGRRPVRSAVSLLERAADDKQLAATYLVRSEVSIEPLYDVSVSPLEFKLVSGCDLVGASEVVLRVRFPDDRNMNTHVDMYKLNTYEGNRHTFAEFAQAYPEVGQSSNFVKPVVEFTEEDPNMFINRIPAGGEPLLPGTTYTVDTLLVKKSESSCQAGIRYSVTYRLREYLYID